MLQEKLKKNRRLVPPILITRHAKSALISIVILCSPDIRVGYGIIDSLVEIRRAVEDAVEWDVDFSDLINVGWYVACISIIA